MLHDPVDPGAPENPSGVEFVLASTDADLRRAATVQNVAYGEDGTTEAGTRWDITTSSPTTRYPIRP